MHPGPATPPLDWFVGWRPKMWAPAVRWILDGEQFAGRRLLELGCREGRMACLFALLGADVTGVDVDPSSLPVARRTAQRLEAAVRFQAYDGDVDALDDGYDFVFTKSVLVVLDAGTAVPAIQRRLVPGGRYLACENLQLPGPVNRLRRYGRTVPGIGGDTLALLRREFQTVDVRRVRAVVAAIKATAGTVASA